ncbi:MAG: hypothetical protein HYY93_02455 [Planctomycetes bacterium]|nr:hypothetical protein [Planctomycetota bacterium]
MPMTVERTPDGFYVIVSGGDRLKLSRSRYEDVYFALPLDNGTLFRLLNDTICNTDELRAAYKALVANAGGMQPALTALQEAVKQVAP